MKQKILNTIVIILLTGFIGFLVFSSTKISLNFDASYNLLSYQSLFNGKGFYYEYAGKKIPFDPVISTGPELYLPTLLIWKLLGKSDYFAGVYTVIVFYVAFLLFFLFRVLDTPEKRLISLSVFLLWFFSSGYIFGKNYNLALDPLGEVIASFLIFTGVYFLFYKHLFFGFLFLGLALDAKTNIIIALVPIVIIYIFLQVIVPELRQRKYMHCFKSCIKVGSLSFLIFLPYLTYSIIAPKLFLNPADSKILHEARSSRGVYMTKYGFGQVIDLYKAPNAAGVRAFLTTTRDKLDDLHSSFGDSYLLLTLFGTLLVFMFFYSKQHFTFYLFIFSALFFIWWLFMPPVSWTRYFFVSEFIFILGLCAFLPSLLEQKKTALLVLLLIIFTGLSLPRYSITSIRESLSGKMRGDILLMKAKIQNIDEKKIYAFGWLQCPQLMLLTNKRFQNILNPENCEKDKTAGRYFLTMYESVLLDNAEMIPIIRDCELVASYGYNNLYRFK